MATDGISSKTKFDIEQASNQNLDASARKNYSEDAEAGVKDDNAKMMPDYGPKDYIVAPDGVNPDEKSHSHPHGGKGPKSYGKDHGAKMTEDPKSYRSSMSKHWHQSNLLSENPIVNHATEK